MKRVLVLCVVCAVLSVDLAAQRAGGVPAPRPSPREAAPVDLTGYWVSVVTEDWAWRMRTPPKGDFASVPLNAEGRRVANTWIEAQDGSCQAYGAAALLRMPGRLHITWEDDATLKIEADAGTQTRLLRFGPRPTGRVQLSLQGHSTAEWLTTGVVTGSGADGGAASTRVSRQPWASLKVVTTAMRAAWLRPNGVPYSESAVMTEYFDRFADGQDEWFAVTTIVEDARYLTEPFVISSNFKREPDGSKWKARECKG